MAYYVGYWCKYNKVRVNKKVKIVGVFTLNVSDNDVKI